MPRTPPYLMTREDTGNIDHEPDGGVNHYDNDYQIFLASERNKKAKKGGK